LCGINVLSTTAFSRRLGFCLKSAHLAHFKCLFIYLSNVQYSGYYSVCSLPDISCIRVNNNFVLCCHIVKHSGLQLRKVKVKPKSEGPAVASKSGMGVLIPEQ
jgi:hypothetical protein